MEIKSAEGASHIGGVKDICLTFHFALDIPTLTFKTITYFLLQAEHNTQTRNKKENKQLIWTFSGKVTYEGYVGTMARKLHIHTIALSALRYFFK